MNNISSVVANDPISALASAPRKKGVDKTGEDFESLQKALDSGDLAAAKSAFSALQANFRSPAPPSADGDVAATAAKQGPDLSALAKALDSGDLSAAKTALTDIQKKRQHKADAVGAANSASADAFLAALSGSNGGPSAPVGATAAASRDPFGVSGQSLDIRA